MQSDISMSGSPGMLSPGVTPGRTPGQTPNGAPIPPRRRRPKPQNDPLVRPKKRPQPRPAPHLPTLTNGTGRPTPPPLPLAREEGIGSGFSLPTVAAFQDYPLIMTKKALFDGFRHHVARFSSKKDVDPRKEDDFVRPVRLHRRDPRSLPQGPGLKDEATPSDNPEENKDLIMKAQAKAERDARREAENALVAPSQGGNTHKKLGTNFKKTEQVYRNDLTEEQKARSKLRYEEALPWHLEDFDNKSTWVGNYEAALSDTYAMMAQGSDGAFRVVPLEKWYKFSEKNKFKTLSFEEAEQRYNKKIKEPRWFMDSEDAKRKRLQEQEDKKAGNRLFIGKWERGGGGSGSAKPVTKQENPDVDDLDFQEDRFADDEENMVFEEDDEQKEADERIKRDQLQANVFDLKEEKEYDKQAEMEKKLKEEERTLGKKLKKALMKREKNYIYDSDSGSNPYSEASESDSDTDTEAERVKAEEKEKEKLSDTPKSSPEKLNDKNKGKAKVGSTLGSGTSTPHHRIKKASSSTSLSSSRLNRAGSPLASDASGNESSRSRARKIKSKQAKGTSGMQNQLDPNSRPSSPPAAAAATAIPKKRGHAGSGSDSEGGAAGSGGEMSDGARKRQKLRLTVGSKAGSPNGSRPTSPKLSPPDTGVTGAADGAIRRTASPGKTPRSPKYDLEVRILKVMELT